VPAGDVTTISAKDIPPHDILCAGFPCQAFSISGKRQGFADTRGTLFWDIVRIARHHKPKVLFLENVKNFARHEKGRTLMTVRNALSQLGYDVYYDILNASHYGAPTSRERIYFVCFRKDVKHEGFHFPAPTYQKIYLKDILEEDSQTADLVTARKDIHLWKRDDTPALKPIQIGTMNNGGQGERIYSINGHAITLSAYGGGAVGKTGGYLVNGKVRRLSPRECARVMGFPESFQLPVSRHQAYQQFGNSVVVTVLKQVSSEILKAA
jgi:DNA (cytosine-5)-methyltransferase 1